MVKPDSRNPKLWFEKSQKHFLRVQDALEEGDVEAACFWLHQSMELLIKGAILARPGAKVNKVHQLGMLLNDLYGYYPEARPVLETYRDFLLSLDPFYIEVRYPLDEDYPGPGKVKEYMETAHKFDADLKKIINWQEKP